MAKQNLLYYFQDLSNQNINLFLSTSTGQLKKEFDTSYINNIIIFINSDIFKEKQNLKDNLFLEANSFLISVDAMIKKYPNTKYKTINDIKNDIDFLHFIKECLIQQKTFNQYNLLEILSSITNIPTPTIFSNFSLDFIQSNSKNFKSLDDVIDLINTHNLQSLMVNVPSSSEKRFAKKLYVALSLIKNFDHKSLKSSKDIIPFIYQN